ncbi:MAG: class F sortase [Allobranchiibius sp.]
MAVGVGLVVFAVSDQTHAPQVPLSSPQVALSQQSSSPPSTSPSSTTPSSTTPRSSSSTNSAASVSVPATVNISSIGASSRLLQLGLDADGKIAVPTNAQVKQAAWFTGSPRPGQVGPAVIEGHVDGAGGVRGVFFRLADVKKGDSVQIGQANGTKLTFDVYDVARYPKDDFPAAVVYGNTTGPELRVITCGGSIDPATGRYRDNTVLFARLAG